MARPQEVIHIDPDTKAVKSHNQAFVFDNVFGPESSTQAVYDKIVAPIVNEAFNGFNGTVLCYGQTSSGEFNELKFVRLRKGGVTTLLFIFCRKDPYSVWRRQGSRDHYHHGQRCAEKNRQRSGRENRYKVST